MNRVELLAKVLAEHEIEAGGFHCSCQPYDATDSREVLPSTWEAHVAAALDAALTAQEGERGGAEVAAAVEAVLPGVRLEHYDEEERHLGPCVLLDDLRAALADPAGALATHDAEVLRAAATAADSNELAHGQGDWLDGACDVIEFIRQRADRIEAQP